MAYRLSLGNMALQDDCGGGDAGRDIIVALQALKLS